MALNGKYLEDADRLLEAGDYVQASEKYWGAMAEIVKAIAEGRVSTRRAAGLLDQSVEDLKDLFVTHGIDPPFDL